MLCGVGRVGSGRLKPSGTAARRGRCRSGEVGVGSRRSTAAPRCGDFALPARRARRQRFVSESRAVRSRAFVISHEQLPRRAAPRNKAATRRHRGSPTPAASPRRDAIHVAAHRTDRGGRRAPSHGVFRVSTHATQRETSQGKGQAGLGSSTSTQTTRTGRHHRDGRLPVPGVL